MNSFGWYSILYSIFSDYFNNNPTLVLNISIKLIPKLAKEDYRIFRLERVHGRHFIPFNFRGTIPLQVCKPHWVERYELLPNSSHSSPASRIHRKWKQLAAWKTLINIECLGYIVCNKKNQKFWKPLTQQQYNKIIIIILIRSKQTYKLF